MWLLGELKRSWSVHIRVQAFGIPAMGSQILLLDAIGDAQDDVISASSTASIETSRSIPYRLVN